MSTTQEKFLSYRGTLQALGARGCRVFFVTRHAEKRVTPLYTLDLENYALSETPLTELMTVMCVDEQHVWLGSETGQVWDGASLLLQLEPAQPIRALAVLAQQCLAVLQEDSLQIVDYRKAQVLQRFALDEKASTLAVDATGQWLCVGSSKGTVQVYECESQPEWVFSAAEKLHEGAVTALCFNPDEPRFLSAGSDNRLLLTHARGKLEPEDRARGVGHDKPVTALIQTQGERFISGGKDQTCKCWIRNGGTRPATFADNTGAVVALAIAKLHERPHLVIASEDRMRVIILDAEGKFGNLTHRFFDVYEALAHELKQTDAARRQQAINQLASLDDAAAIKLLTQQAKTDSDHSLRKLATDKLGGLSHAQAQTSLEGLLSHADAAVRIAAFTHLLAWPSTAAPSDWCLKVTALAFKTNLEDIGKLAVSALEPWARQDDRALTQLIQALNAKPYAVRCFALLSLERVHDDADLLALNSSEADLRCAALIRMLQRDLLALPRVQAALRRRLDEPAKEVRQTAFLVSIASRPALAKALRERDASIHKRLFDMEQQAFDASAPANVELPKLRKSKFQLEARDYEPLLQASTALSLDVSALAAYLLALLEDPRAFGLLLQLSRASDTAARIVVCQSLAILRDVRAKQRLQTLLNDNAIEVRDAAYSALLALHENEPLVAVELGFASQHVDVRQRGLQTLTRLYKDGCKEGHVPEEYHTLLLWALNDSLNALRNEAFKVIVNAQRDSGNYEAALRFVLQSSHADIRREVQTELIAEANTPWAWNLLLELLNDPDSNIREQTLSFALKKTKGRDLAPLASALNSRYAGTRMQAVRELLNKPNADAQALLLTALNDEDQDVRVLVMQNLVSSASPALLQALQNSHQDVVLQAALACARLGETAALQPLLGFVSQPQPNQLEATGSAWSNSQQVSPAFTLWQNNLVSALAGLADLAHPDSLSSVIPLLDSSISAIRQAAAKVLLWCHSDASRGALQAALRHQDAEVKQTAALALVWQGDDSALQLLLGNLKSTEHKLQLVAALLALGEDYLDYLTPFLDDSDYNVRRATLYALMLQEYRHHGDVPIRLLAILSAATAEFRLLGAQLVGCFAGRERTGPLLLSWFNRPERNWQIPQSSVDSLGDIFALAPAALNYRALTLFSKLDADKQEAWDAAWQFFNQRYAQQINALSQRAAKRKPVKLNVDQTELNHIALGTYCGLLRESASTGKNKAQEERNVLSVRVSALRCLLALCQQQPELNSSVQPVFMQALGDKNQEVRLLALSNLQALAMPATELAAECLETGYNDLGVKALEMLIAGGSLEQGQTILRQAMLSRNDELALEAAKLLLKTQDPVNVAEAALEANFEAVRLQAVGWLIEHYAQARVQTLLHATLDSRYAAVRQRCAYALAQQKDPHAIPALARLLNEARQPREQTNIVDALLKIGSSDCAQVLLDRIEHDPSNSAAHTLLFNAIGSLRHTSLVPSLLRLMDNKNWRGLIFNALLRISGHDQRCEDPDDLLPHRDWMQKQAPRHDEVLQQLLERCLELGETDSIVNLLFAARWSLSDAVVPTLITLSKHSHDDVRRASVYALGWRIYKRNGDANPVLAALSHKDPLTQFWAAHELANAGKKQGMVVLLSAVNTLDDLELRKRAVRALGELADERALDTLLNFANDDTHALQETAAEAIGHMGKTSHADTIFALLKRFATGDRPLLKINALRGLRYFDSREGWELLRNEAAIGNGPCCEVALELLAYNPDVASQEVLLKVLADEYIYDYYKTIALNSARRLFATEDLSPDYAYLSSGCELSNVADDFARCVQRVTQTGKASEIFKIYDSCSCSVKSHLANYLLQLQPAPVAEANSALTGLQSYSVSLAASILAYANASPSNLDHTLRDWISRWQKACDEHGSSDELSSLLQRLIWLAGKQGCALDQLRLLAQLANLPQYQSVREAAYQALAPHPQAQNLFQQALHDENANIRQLASRVCQQVDEQQLAQLISDKRVYQTLAQHSDTQALDSKALSNRHHMGIVLTRVIAQQAVGELLATAQNPELDELQRLGAIEGLGQVANFEAESALRQLGEQSELDEDLRRMAWRCLKRAKRLRGAGRV